LQRLAQFVETHQHPTLVLELDNLFLKPLEEQRRGTPRDVFPTNTFQDGLLEFLATQTGLAFAQTFDPSQGTQGAMVSTFLSLIGALLVFETGLHHLAIGAIAGSYTLIPPNQAFPTADVAELTLSLVAGAFALGLQLAAPFLVFGLLIYAILGVLSRLMPQLQIFFLAMPINILTGFVILMLFLGVMMSTFLDFFAVQMRLFGG